MRKPIRVNMYTRTVCPLCEQAKEMLLQLKTEFDLEINEIDIYEEEELLERYQIMIPVIEINGEEVDYGMIDKETIRNHLLSKSNCIS